MTYVVSKTWGIVTAASFAVVGGPLWFGLPLWARR
jgi:hypothetical protein